MRTYKYRPLVGGAIAILSACGGADNALTTVPTQVTAALYNTSSTHVDPSYCTEVAITTGAYQWIGEQCTLASALLATSATLRAQANSVTPRATTAAAVASIDATAFFNWA